MGVEDFLNNKNKTETSSWFALVANIFAFLRTFFLKKNSFLVLTGF